jgi:tRNA pseudouridine13 synthase
MISSYSFKDNDEKEIEKFVGISTYSTYDIEGLGGIYKNTYRDFIVKEVTKSGKILEIKEDSPTIQFTEKSKDRFTTFNFVKINKEPFESFRNLGKALKVPTTSIHYCGLKDKTSISVQKISIKGNFVEKLKKLKIRNLFFRSIIPTKNPVKLGDHWGNNFTIVIRNIEDHKNLEERIEEHINKIKEFGFPNYFGLQRFGTFRPNTHLIGQYLLEEDYKKAFYEYVTTTYSSESPEIIRVRTELRESGDLEKAYEQFPNSLNYERKFIKYLLEHPGDYEGSFKTLSPDLKTLILNAFQSYIFNKLVSFRMKKGFSLLEGDSVSILDDVNGHVTKVKYTYGGNYDKYLEEAIRLNRAVIVIPIVGYNTNFEEFPLLKLFFKEILKQEGIPSDIFKGEVMINNEFKGSFRSLTVKPIGLEKIEFTEDDVFSGKKKLKLEFSLQKGSYATMLIRELIK